VELELPDLRAGYVDLVDEALGGARVASRGLAHRELTAVTLVFRDPLAPLLPVAVGRRVNLRLAAVEALQVIAGAARGDLLWRAAPTYARVLVDPGDLTYGAYGPRLAEQLRVCVDLLRADPGTRRAVAAVWRVDDLTHDGDRPCTVFLQFLVRPQRVLFDAGAAFVENPPALELHVHMRSQDVWLGVPYDVFMFTQLQHTVARELRVPAGRYVHHVTSLHLYESDVERARELVDAWRQRGGPPRHPGPDPSADLPLGVVAGGDATGFDVAGYLLDDVNERRGDPATRDANAWYAARVAELRTWR
jgi:thymidylate synthase